MQTKESIFQLLVEILVELAEVEAEAVTAESRLNEDLDIDSIDAVDMIVKLKQITNKRIEPSEFKNVRTVQDVVDAVYKVVVSESAISAETSD